jgi:hypothetical protein
MTMKDLAVNMEELKKKMKELHTPIPQEMVQWKEGVADMWPQLVGDNKELADALKETRAILGR